MRYNDVSVLEMHHAATTWRVIIETKILRKYSNDQIQILRKRIVGSILQTDMKFHGEHVKHAGELELEQNYRMA